MPWGNRAIGYRWDNLWRPYTPSIICVEDMHFAFNLAEMTEYIPAKKAKNRYVRDEQMSRWARGKNSAPFLHVSKHTMPTGRFLLQLYSPYESADWLVQFRQTKQCGLISQIIKDDFGDTGGCAADFQAIRRSQNQSRRVANPDGTGARDISGEGEDPQGGGSVLGQPR